MDLDITLGILETLMPQVRLEEDGDGVYGIECSMSVQGAEAAMNDEHLIPLLERYAAGRDPALRDELFERYLPWRGRWRASFPAAAWKRRTWSRRPAWRCSRRWNF